MQLIVVALLFLRLKSMAASTPQQEIAALERLYNSTGGSAGHWNFPSMNSCILDDATTFYSFGFVNLTGSSWDFKKNAAGYELDPCAARSSGKNFAGIGCTCTASQVCSITQIGLPCGNLIGSLGSVVAALKDITLLGYVDMHQNALTGTIPRTTSEMLHLVLLDLAGNLLTGTIPRELENLANLENLDLDVNSLTGTIPRELGSLANLKVLYLHKNSLTGSIPHELGGLTNLKLLFIATNSLTGVIPRELGNLTNALGIDVSSNILTGTVPHELGNLANLEAFSFSGNKLTGTIPSDLGNLSNLKAIDLSANSMTGTIPSELGNLRNQEVLLLYENSLTGCIPSNFGQLLNLEQLDFSGNTLTGTIPATFSTLIKLKRFIVQGNNLQSSGDTDTFNFINPALQQSLVYLDVSSNNFTGSISASVFSLPSLRVFSAGSNCFRGTLPSNICDATKLVTLDLSSLSSGPGCREYIWARLGLENVFTGFVAASSMQGSLPSCLFELPYIQALRANSNQFPGELPTTISSSLNTITLSRNKLHGTIPKLLATALNLTTLDLSNNRIRGNLDAFTSSSDELFFTRKGMKLHLQVNHLSGDIPNSLWNLNTINILSGNVFACPPDGNELPIHNPKRDSYQCGSSDMNRQMYTGYTLILFFTILLFYMKKLPETQRCFAKFDHWLRVAAGRKLLGYEFASAQMMKYTRNLEAQRGFAFKIGLATTVLLICYVSLSGISDQTVGISYGWVVTALYLTGPKSTMVILSFGIIFVSYIWFLILLDERSVPASRTLNNTRVVENGEEVLTFSMKLRTVMLPVLRLLFLIAILWGFIIGGNFWYIAIQLNGASSDQKIFQLCFAAFKIFWSIVVTPFLFESETLHFGVNVKHHDAFIRSVFGGNYQLLFMMNIFTMFWIPILTLAVVNDTCFYNVFYQAVPEETNAHLYVTVNFGIGFNSFFSYDIQSVTAAPFTYGYSCSNTIMRLYIPLYMQMCILLIWKSIASLIYLCWDARESEKSLEDPEPGRLHMLFMNLLRRMTPTKQLLYGSERRRAMYKPGRIFKSRVKLWMTRPIPGTLANTVILLTFGCAAPPLAMMLVTSILMDSYVCQLVLGRFIDTEVTVLLEQKRQLEVIVQTPPNAEVHLISLMRRSRVQDAIKDIEEPWGALAALKEVEAQCAHVPASTLMRGRSLFVLITSLMFAGLLCDVENSTPALEKQEYVQPGSAIAMVSFAFALVSLSWIYNKWSVFANSNKINAERNGNSGQNDQDIEMSENIESVSGSESKKGSTKNPIIYPTINVDEVPRAFVSSDTTKTDRNGNSGQRDQDIEMSENIESVSVTEMKRKSTENSILDTALLEDEIPSAY